MRIFILLIFTCFLRPQSTHAQFDVIYHRYASTWVDGKAKSIRALPVAINNTQKSLQLLIPKKDQFFEMPNGNRFLNVYLVNNTNSKAVINRYDATVRSITTEILIGDQWKLLQVKHAPSCGNGSWKMVMEPGHFIALQIDHMIGGKAEVKFRVRYKTLKYDVTSNPVTLFIREELIASAGTVPTSADRDP